MNDLERVRAKTADVRLSLEALSSVGKTKVRYRPLSEALAEWRAKPAEVSPELRKQFTGAEQNSEVAE